MTHQSPNYLSDKIEMRTLPDKGGYGIFALCPIQKDEVLTVWGGSVVNKEELKDLSDYQRTHGMQIEEDLFQIPLTDNDPAEMVNHSCDPNAGLLGQITLVAFRDIAAGEEICFDYAMTDSIPYDEFTCQCGSPHCRGKVTGDDWQRPDLQLRYQGYFSAYLQRRISRNLGTLTN
jgi:hypothetical protein